MGGAHGDGKVDVVFDPALAGASTWDAPSKACAAACHARQGAARPRPLWTEKGPLGCNDCHSSPPPAHYAGACSGCHREANATGTALTSPRLHVNGVADVGDGSGTCGACHGKGDDPWPSSGAHAAHRSPGSAAPVPCVSCHVIPTAFGPGTDHPRADGARVTFSGRALTKGAPATYANGTCTNVYCHGGNLVGTVAAAPAWNDPSGKDKACGSCHGLPPGPPHLASTACELCHGKGVESSPSGPRIVPAQRDLHVDGQLGH
jgi:predicted CxxxxCH...CXXCH cytochrome family protein